MLVSLSQGQINQQCADCNKLSAVASPVQLLLLLDINLFLFLNAQDKVTLALGSGSVLSSHLHP